MNWISDLNNALDYIEANLDQNLDIGEIAAQAYTSKFHFQRLFYAIAGYKLSEYIRLRRLTLAAKDLTSTDLKVIDIALKYGYETPEAFSKAFKKLHGIPPSAVRKGCQKLQAVPPLTFQLTVKGEKRMDYQVVEKEAFKLTGYKRRVTTRNNENFKVIPAFWEALHKEGKVDRLFQQSPDGDVIGAAVNFDGDENFDYLIAVRAQALDGMDGEVITVDIPASKWAIFSGVGELPEAIQKTWKQIYHEWFPATTYEHAGTAELEVYPAECESEEGMRYEVWIPIVDGKK